MQAIISRQAARQREIDIRGQKGTHFLGCANCFHICGNGGRRLFSSGSIKFEPNSYRL
jgi:hypothetical protein